MKLQCKVEVVNRLHNSLNVKSHGRQLKSTLAIGVEPKSLAGYFMIHFSSVNKTGTKYSVKTITHVFTKCINEGKATIRFAEPPHDLCINCEPIQLKCFMKLLRSCVTGNTKDAQLTNLSNISVTANDNAPTKLVIKDRNEFPTKGIPRTVENLFMKDLKLCNFRREILLLKHLIVLDLSNNEIEKIPPEFGRMPNLRELYLANNQLGIKSAIDWKWLLGPQIKEKLKLLDLTGNKLKYLPKNLWKLQKLVTLKIDNNLIEELPASVGRITSLRYLTLSHNKLNYLPCSLLQCRLDHLDVSYNSCDYIRQSDATWLNHVDSLVNLAAKIVLNTKIYYSPNIIPWTLVEDLDDAKMCLCGAPVLSDVFYIKKFRLKDHFSVVVCDETNSGSVSFKCYICSAKCFANHAVSLKY